MNITVELLQEQANNVVKNLDGYKQGYIEALAWAKQVLSQKEQQKALETDSVGGPEAAR